MMNDTSSLDEAKNKITDAIRTLNEAHKKELIDVINSAFDSQEGQQSPDDGEERTWWPFYWIFCGIIVAAIVVAKYGTFETHFFGDKGKGLLLFLAFVVSLSAYLANVAREIQKKISEGNARDPARLKGNIRYMAPAEMSLVIISLITVLRLIYGSPICDIDVDHLLLSYLSVTIFYMAFLHVRRWCQIKPWKL